MADNNTTSPKTPKTPAADDPRLKIVEKILRCPSAFKVCEGCDSIGVKGKVSICPVCDAYRWDADPARVRETAYLLATRKSQAVLKNQLAGDRKYA